MFVQTIIMEFIEVDVITKDKDGKKIFPKETIACDEIRSFRPWHKGELDMDVEGEITILILKSSKPTDGQATPKSRQVLVKEGYDSFIDRMRTRVSVK